MNATVTARIESSPAPLPSSTSPSSSTSSRRRTHQLGHRTAANGATVHATPTIGSAQPRPFSSLAAALCAALLFSQALVAQSACEDTETFCGLSFALASCGTNVLVDEGCQKTCGHCVGATTTVGITTTSTTTTTTRAGRECAQVSTPPVNIVFVVDASNSLKDEEWENTLTFTRNVIEGRCL